MRLLLQRAVDAIEEVARAVVPHFRPSAERLLYDLKSRDSKLDDADILALALAKITGHTSGLRRRSLLTASDDFATLQYRSPWEVERPGQVFGFLRTRLPEEMMNEVGRRWRGLGGSCCDRDLRCRCGAEGFTIAPPPPLLADQADDDHRGRQGCGV